MASGLSFFFSSPTHPTSNTWQHPKTSTYYTPQRQSKHNWYGSAFAPTSPSPLRTSRNANLMSSPLQGGNGFETDGFSVEKSVEGMNDESENVMEALHFSAAASNNLSNINSAQSLDISNPFISTSSFSNTTTQPPPTTSLFTFNSNPTTASQNEPSAYPQINFQFSSASRSSSPSAQLNAHTTATRNNRKRLFLDRLRTRRDDVRSDRTGDQVLRMDFMSERRRWEDEKQQLSRMEELFLQEESDDAGDEVAPAGMDGEVEMSPTDDQERELEALMGEYYATQDGGAVAGGGNRDEEFSDDGYDEAFMEVLSQQSPDFTPASASGLIGWTGGYESVRGKEWHGNEADSGQQQQMTFVSSEMDMS